MLYYPAGRGRVRRVGELAVIQKHGAGTAGPDAWGSDCLKCQVVVTDSRTTTAPPRAHAAEKE
jgi:hypothetical protein